VNEVRRSNPYDFVADVKDPKLFAGRRAELAAVREEILRIDATPPIFPVVALVGERRVGKTSILHRVAELARERHVLPCRVNLTAATASDPWEFWHETLQSVLSAAYRAGALYAGDEGGFGFHPLTESRPSHGSPIPGLAFARLYVERSPVGGPALPPSVALSNDLTAIMEALTRARYKAILIILDEAHVLGGSADTVQQLRHLTRAIPGIGVVFSGEPALNQMFTDRAAPFYLQGRVVPVGNFTTKADVAECVLLPLSQGERPLVSPMTVDHLTRLSHGKPNQIRLLCHSIYRRYERRDQDDLRITIEALDDVLDTIEASYAEEQGLRERVDAIRRLRSADLEVLYLATRYPAWRVEDIIALDEAFRGERVSPLAAARRAEQLRVRCERFVSMGLLEGGKDRYVLVGGEFVYLYLRFWYEVRKYGDLSRRVDLSEGSPTPFGEKVDKLIRSLALEVGQQVELIRLGFARHELPREQAIAAVRRRFKTLASVIGSVSVDPESRASSLVECFDVCHLVGKPGQYYLLVLAIRNLENPRETIVAEVYFRAADPIVFPVSLMREQAESAKILVEEFDAWQVTIPSLEDLVRASSGRELEEIIGGLDVVRQWVIRSVRRLVTKGEDPVCKNVDAKEELPKTDVSWIKLYQEGETKAAIDAITERLATEQKRPEQARMYNDRGYIRYVLPEQRDMAERDLQMAADLHHHSLALTLLNLAVLAIDSDNFGLAIDHINDALLITLGRESLSASYLRLRLLPGLPAMVRRERWEQHPANVLEAAYVNLAYAVGRMEGYEGAERVLREALELLPSSVQLRHALGRVYLARHRAPLADPIYEQLAASNTEDQELRHEVRLYLKTSPVGRKRKKG
jgi:tetratricopeptide (TPR) repeat protein